MCQRTKYLHNTINGICELTNMHNFLFSHFHRKTKKKLCKIFLSVFINCFCELYNLNRCRWIVNFLANQLHRLEPLKISKCNSFLFLFFYLKERHHHWFCAGVNRKPFQWTTFYSSSKILLNELAPKQWTSNQVEKAIRPVCLLKWID